MTNKDIVLSAMRSTGRADALNLISRIDTMTDTEIIDEEEKIPAFDGTKDYRQYPAGFPVTDEGQVWELLQPYNAAEHPGTRPSTIRAIWGLKHTKNPRKAKPFVPAYGTSGLYYYEECYLDNNGDVQICDVEQTNFTAEEWPGGWRKWDGGDAV